MNKPKKKTPQTYYYVGGQQTNDPGLPSQSTKPPRRHRRRWLLAVGLVIVVIGAVAAYVVWGSGNPVSSISHKVFNSVATKPKATAPVGLSAASLATMSQSINSVISANSGIDMSVSLIDLRNNQIEHYGVDQTFQAASTAKILTAAYFLHQVEVGQESLSKTINGSTAQYELQQMIVVSDDNAWDALNDELGYNSLQAYVDSTLGISDYQAYNNVLSSDDIALALQKLWDGSLLNSTNTQLLLSYLQQADYRQYIVSAIPSEDTIYHKIGLYEDNVHDAAIVAHGSQAFVVVIFTNGNGIYNWTDRATIMQTIAKATLAAYFGQS